MNLVEIFNKSTQLEDLFAGINQKKKKVIYCSPISGSAKPLFVKRLFKNESQIVFLLPDVQLLNEIKVELSLLGHSDDLIVVDEFKIEQLQEKLTLLSSKDNFILLSLYDILRVELPQKKQLEKGITKIQIGSEISYDELIEYLNLLNYQKNKFVENVGDFSVRGSIIDFWSYSESNPCRLEFDGDFIESIRHFDAESQRSSDKVEAVTISANLERAETIYNSDIFDYLDNPLIFASKFELNKIFNNEKKVNTSHQPTVIDDVELAEELTGGINQKNFDESTPSGSTITSALSLTSPGSLGPDGEALISPDLSGTSTGVYNSATVFDDVDDYKNYTRIVNTSRLGQYRISVTEIVYADTTNPGSNPLPAGQTFCKRLKINVYNNPYIDSVRTPIALYYSVTY